MSSQVDKRTDLPTHIVLEQVRGLDGPSLIMLEQLKTIDKRRVRSYAGKLTKEQMAEVEAALTGTLGIYITEAVEAP
jgi:mRNA interferase MazF